MNWNPSESTRKAIALLITALALCAGAVVVGYKGNHDSHDRYVKPGECRFFADLVKPFYKAVYAILRPLGVMTLTEGDKMFGGEEALAKVRTRLLTRLPKPYKGVSFQHLRENGFLRYMKELDTQLNAQYVFEDAEFVDCHICWLSQLPTPDFRKAKFTDKPFFDHCKLRGVQFGASLDGCTVVFDSCDLYEASLVKSAMNWVKFHWCDVRECDFRQSQFKDVVFETSELSGSNLSGASWRTTIFDIKPKTLPYIPSFAAFDGLEHFDYWLSPSALAELRKEFKEAGLRKQERQITAAWQTHETQAAPWLERCFKTTMFDWTCRYGLAPWRPLVLIVILCVLCSVPYSIAILRHPRLARNKPEAVHYMDGMTDTPNSLDASQGGIWAVPLEKRVAETSAAPERVHIDLHEIGWCLGLCRASWNGFFFSVISAFSTGYKDLDVGRWIERITRKETTLRPTGWVRTLSGVQSLVSFYLLALWLLTYFGRPFE